MHINLKIEKPALSPGQFMLWTVQFLAVLSGHRYLVQHGYWFAVIGIEMQELQFSENRIFKKCGWHVDSKFGANVSSRMSFKRICHWKGSRLTMLWFTARYSSVHFLVVHGLFFQYIVFGCVSSCWEHYGNDMIVYDHIGHCFSTHTFKQIVIYIK